MKVIVQFLLAATLFCAPQSAGAQAKAKVNISSVRQKGKSVAFTVSSPAEFYVGGNEYVLYIGNKQFTTYKQDNTEGKGRLIYQISQPDYKSLKEGARIYLTYGDLPAETGSTNEELSKQPDSKCWPLGRFTKRLLTK